MRTLVDGDGASPAICVEQREGNRAPPRLRDVAQRKTATGSGSPAGRADKFGTPDRRDPHARSARVDAVTARLRRAGGVQDLLPLERYTMVTLGAGAGRKSEIKLVELRLVSNAFL